MSQPELLRKVIAVLETHQISYMLTGSVVSSLQGEPRSTHDIDIVVAIQADTVSKMAQSFSPPDFYLDEDGIREAIRRRSMFNLIDCREGDKIDFWILTDAPFDNSRFQRRTAVNLWGHSMFVSTPEDTILAKLNWARLMGGSEKQLRDAGSVYEVQYEDLDFDYVQQWAERLGVTELWQKIKDVAEGSVES